MIDSFRYAYIEFDSTNAFMRSKLLNETLFHGRQITVIPKRKNLPGQGKPQASGFLDMFNLHGRGRGAAAMGQQAVMMAGLMQMASVMGAAATSMRGRGARNNNQRGSSRGRGGFRPY